MRLHPKSQIRHSVLIASAFVLAMFVIIPPFATPLPLTPSPPLTIQPTPLSPTRPLRPKPKTTNPLAQPAPVTPTVLAAVPPNAITTSTTPTPDLPILPGNGHPNYPYTALGASRPLSPNRWFTDKVNAPAAWSVTPGSSNVVVAVIDTGFALNHEALRNQWWTNPGEIGPTSSEGPAPNCTSQGLALDKSCNNLDNDGDGYASDWRGWDFVDGDNNPVAGKTTPSSTAAFHGSFVAGLVGGASDNANGDSGVAWGARIMPLQVLADTGTGYTDAIANAIDYAVAHGASVINLSLGSSYNDPFLHQSIDAAIAAGVTVVAASGNSNCDCILYPANYPETIAVGATDTSDARASFSSYGANLDLVAPGANVCSAFWTVANSTTSYGCGQGTSFATPLVAGAAALILSRHGTAKPADIARYLAEGADSVAAMATDTTHQYGAGRLDITQALLQATQPTTPKDSIPASIASGPDISTLCQSPAGTSCSLKLTGPTGTVITVAAKTTDRWGSAEFYWQPAQLGLTPGLWKVETMSTMLGDVSPSYVQVSG